MSVSCNPSDLANAAYCFSSCGGDQMAIRDLLLLQFVPCVPAGSPAGTVPSVGCRAPLAPASLEVSNSPNNPGSTTITVDWTQPLNIPPVAATGYVVKWGTSSGNYNVGSAAIGPAPLAYTITGLANSTTYFIVVYALNGLCVSGASNEIQGTTMNASGACNAGTVFAQAWAARVVANGGANPSAATQLAIANFQCGLIADGLDTQMLSWNALVSDSLIAAFTPQLLSGVRDPWTNAGPFVLADLTINGLKGDGIAKFSNSGVVAASIYSSDDDCGISIYIVSNPNSNSCDVGTTQGGLLTSIQPFGGTTFFDSYTLAGRISAANAGFTGFISGNRVAGPTTSIYEASSTVPFNTLVTANIGPGGVRPNNEYYMLAMDNSGVASSFSDHRISFIAWHHGLSAANAQKLYNRVQAYLVARGGGFV